VWWWRGPLVSFPRLAGGGALGRPPHASPWGIGAVRLTDEAFALVQANPQSVYVEENGVTRAVPFPFEAVQASTGPFTEANLRQVLGLAPDAVVQPQLVPTIETLGADAFERRAAKDDPLEDLRLAAGLTLNPMEGMMFRATGRMDRQRAEPVSFTSVLMNPNARRVVQQDGFGLAAMFDHTLLPALRYTLRASIERDAYVSHPLGFTDAVEDVLLYGDIDNANSDIASRYYVQLSGGYVQQFTRDSGTRPGQYLGQLYSLPGRQNLNQFTTGEQGSIQVGGSIHLDVGAHQIELGAEMQQQMQRQFTINGFSLAGYVNDGSLENSPPTGFPNGVRSYDQLAFRELQTRTSYYGYSFNGLATADSEDIDAYYDNTQGGRSKDIAPFQPRLLAGYAEATSSFGLLTTRIGLRLEGYDPNGNALFDLYSPIPIRRAGDLALIPEGIGPDYAVYFASNETTVVGFRDLDGNFFDAAGAPTTPNAVIVDEQAQVVQKEGAPRSEAFHDAPTIWSVEPRLRAELAASDSLRFYVSAERLSRSPDPALSVSLGDFRNLSGLSFRTGMVMPAFETVDAVRLGVEALVSPTLSASMTGFVRKTRGIPAAIPLAGSFPRYGAFIPFDRLDEVGVDVTAAWQPSSAALVQIAYTLASAEGTSSSANAVSVLIWRAGNGDPFPNSVNTAGTDTRHAIDLVASGRVPSEGFSVLGGFGGGFVLSAQSGLPYTGVEPNTGFTSGDSFTTPAQGGINGARLPWTHQFDVRLDRQIPVGLATLEVFAWIENVFGTENVLAVYRSTGRPDDDGYLETANGQSQFSTPERQALYRAYISGPVNVGGNQSAAAPFFYGQPRQIRLGLRASF
ncbi:MAG: hypothetical protein AAF170_09980, partial [Bacteroidota bacterium]